MMLVIRTLALLTQGYLLVIAGHLSISMILATSQLVMKISQLLTAGLVGHFTAFTVTFS